MAGLVETLAIDRARMRAAAEEGYTTATALADALVRRGVPFRAAHHIVGGLVGGAEAERIPSLAALPDEAYRAALDGSDDPVARGLAKEKGDRGGAARGGDDRGRPGRGRRHRRHRARPRGAGAGRREGAPRGRMTRRPTSAPSIGRSTDVARVARSAMLRLNRRQSCRRDSGETTRWRKFMDVHDGFFGVTGEQLREAHDADLAIEGDEGVHFERAWLDPEAGKVFCLATGPSKEAVMRIHERAGHPTPEVYELTVEV